MEEAMQDTCDFLTSLGLPAGDAYDLPTSIKRFPDGAQCRVEIPRVEGPRATSAFPRSQPEDGFKEER
ncbi:MAG: hypothetical protein JXA41_06880 [Deltaproteobacteria bacterium]|nr:hypothetical protein [Deltaproteobacteria bacterium]